jgi:serine/threonine protein kinase
VGDPAASHEERFELRGELGSGGTGVVYRVHDRLRGHDVALKALRAKGPNALYRFKREFRELCDLAHPNLVQLHELYVVGDEWMFTMELVDGVQFRDWVVVDRARLVPALIQLVDALTALHTAGMIHRDVKNSNVLIQPDGRVVLLDFGLVRDSEVVDATHDGAALGTPAYMSPEQAADVPLTPATDWYAVGVMLYEVLTGRKPFRGPASSVLLDKQRIDPVPPSVVAGNVPPELEALCLQMLARDPRRRPTGPEVLAALGAGPSPWTRRITERTDPAVVAIDRAAELAELRGRGPL